MWGKIALALLLVVCVAGCASTKKVSKETQIKQLKTQVGNLQTELQKKEQQLASLESQPAGSQQAETKAPISEPAMTSKNIQTALKNAGFYLGEIDGKVGSQTKKAIKDFQEANGLTADGIVGKKTWAKLKNYL